MLSKSPEGSTIELRNEEGGKAIVFVHGLSGSPLSTWKKMAECFDSDPDFTDTAIDYYAYPTRLIRLPFTPPLPGLRDLAAGLRTFLEEQHGMRSAISIIAHSLGGLIVRHMIASAVRSQRPLTIKNVALLAVPSTGATLANVGSLISLPHRQLKTLCRDEDGLSTLNIDWEELKVEEAVRVRYIMGGSDRTVPADSAAPYIGRDNKSVIIDADHRSIVAPESKNDLRYKTIKRFLLTGKDQAKSRAPLQIGRRIERPADPLFDVYTPANEPYYVYRLFDKIVSEVLARGHIWLTGESGIGKSAAARRAVYSSGWRLYHLSLSGHEIGDAKALFRAVCSELLSLTQAPAPIIATSTFSEQVFLAKNVITELCSDKLLAIVIEEMPLESNHMASYTDMIATFLNSLDADETLYGQVRFVFSSIQTFTHYSAGLSGKVREKIRFLPVETWSSLDIDRLVRLLTPAIKPDLSPSDQNHIVVASRGSPRFVKMTFRHWRNGTSENASVEALCSQVEKEMIP